MSWLRKALTSMDNPKQMVEHMIPHRGPTPRNVPHAENVSAAVPVTPTVKSTSPLQQQLWLAEFRKAQAEAQVATAKTSASPRGLAVSPRATPRTPLRPGSISPGRQHLSPSRRVAALFEEVNSPTAAPEPEPSKELTKFYYEQREAGIVMDYSTFDDDAESVSSVQLLFNWLTCKDASDKMRIDHRGKLVVATDSLLSDNLSWPDDEKKRTRTSHKMG